MVRFSVEYIVHCSVQYSVQYSIQYIIQYIVDYSARYILQQALKVVFLWRTNCRQLIVWLQYIVPYSAVQYSFQCISQYIIGMCGEYRHSSGCHQPAQGDKTQIGICKSMILKSTRIGDHYLLFIKVMLQICEYVRKNLNDFNSFRKI